MTRDEFMEFFRDNEKLQTLSNDDRMEIFIQVLPGSSDITKKTLDSLISEYSVGGLKIIETDCVHNYEHYVGNFAEVVAVCSKCKNAYF